MDFRPKTRVLLSGLPGRMATEVAALASEHSDEFELLEPALVGPEISDTDLAVAGKRFRAIPPGRRGDFLKTTESLRPFIAVDYTLPAAIGENVAFYCDNEIPFVMGTTGGTLKEIQARVAHAGITAVVAPNMAIPIVLIQAAARWVATTFPGALTGYSARVRESHQSAKKDTSGTAKALIADLEALGIPVDPRSIEKIRDPETQKALGVPEEFLPGHAYHTYFLQSPDGTVALSLSHNIHGRRVYAEGTLWAVRFLRRQLEQGNPGTCFNMQDVLRGIGDLA